MKRRLLLSALISLSSATLMGQPQQVDWFTATFLGSLWRDGQPREMTDTSFVEASLRPLLPTQALEDLRFSRHPRGSDLAHRLAISAACLTSSEDPTTLPILTDSLLILQRDDDSHSIDVRAYLRLRLFDHLVGDWSRSASDIRWYPRSLPSETLWIPAPDPYRNAFTRYDGLLPSTLVRISDQMSSWSDDPTETLRDANPLRTLDRRLLSSVSWATWDSAASDLSRRLSDSALDSACSILTLPERARLLPALRSRIRMIPVLAQQYFRRTTRFVEFYGSERVDSFFVKILSTRAVEVSLSEDTTGPRVVNSLAAKEIRFLLQEGDHSVWIEGPEKTNVDIIVDVGEGVSTVRNRRNALQSWNTGSPGSVDLYRTPIDDQDIPRDDTWGSRTVFVPWLDANRDDHLFIGGGPEFTTSAYKAFPYATRTTLLAGIATRTNRFRLEAEFETRSLVRGLSWGLSARFSELSISNFFGLGNETSAPQSLLVRSYFKADQRLFEAAAPMRVLLSEWLSIGLTPKLRMIRTNPRSGSLIDSLISSGYARQLNYLSVQLDALYDSRDRSAIPTTGMFASARLAWAPRGLQNKNSFASVGIDSRYYYYIGHRGMHVLLRTSGEAILGDHPWFESAFIGGSRTLRGYERQRFSGDASFSSALEWRAPLGQLHVLWPFDIGGIAFAESGRVFVDGEHSMRWHSSVGFGAWLQPARSPYTIVVSVAISQELTEVLANFGLPITL